VPRFLLPRYISVPSTQWRKSRGGQRGHDRGDTSPQMLDGEETVMHHVPPPIWQRFRCINDKKIRLYLLNYVIVLFLSNISCLQLCQMFYRGQLCELYYQILDHKQSRCPPPTNFQSDLRHCLNTQHCIYMSLQKLITTVKLCTACIFTLNFSAPAA